MSCQNSKGVFSIFKKDPLLTYDLVIFITVAASSPGANKISCGSLYEGLHEVVHHIIGAQRGVGYERSG
jgi:hypothetical protein